MLPKAIWVEDLQGLEPYIPVLADPTEAEVSEANGEVSNSPEPPQGLGVVFNNRFRLVRGDFI